MNRIHHNTLDGVLVGWVPATNAVKSRTAATHRPNPTEGYVCLCAILLILAAIVFTPLPARAAVTEAWVHRYNNSVSNANQWARHVARDASGDIIVTGFTDDRTTGLDMLTIKYSGANGSMLWARRYNGPANTDDAPAQVAVDANGNVVVAGTSYNDNSFYGADYYTAKYAGTNGSLLWEQRYNGPANGRDGARAVVLDASGNVVVTGYSDSGPPSYDSDYYTAKYAASNGSLLWEKRYSGLWNYDEAVAVAVDGNGNVVVTGSSNSGPPDYNLDYYTAKYAATDGALLWEKRYNGPANKDDAAYAMALDGSGNVVVTGYSSNGTNYDYCTVKYAAADGALLWEKRYNGPGNGYDRAYAVAVDGGGNVAVTGDSRSDHYTAKYAAADGALLWDKHSADGGQNLATDPGGNVVVAGASNNGINYDFYTAKYAAADGALLWEKRYNGPANRNDFAYAVVVDGSGNMVVTGASDNPTNSDYYTAKYAATDGALLWEQRCSGPANYDDRAIGVAVDRNGNLAVTGASSNGTNDDYYTAKYARFSGALLWERRYNGPANREDVPRAVAVDGGGNVVVTGYSLDSTGFADFYTAKYAAEDGTLLWEKRYIGPANGNDYASGLVLDGAGNVVVTGNTFAGLQLTDCYTAKYAAVDGALLWEKRYDGPASGNDGGAAVAVDASGNVVMTGYSFNGNYDIDYYTAKYAAADGALLWEKRYTSPATGSPGSSVFAVAVDGGGNVAIAGDSGNNHYTAKYAAADGALLWEKLSADEGRGLATDSGGNVLVTRRSFNLNRNEDYYTAKYAAVNGALLWEQRYNGPANGSDIPTALAIGGSGNVVVTGYSSNGTNLDYYTVKYAATNGALLWEQRYNGPANGDEIAGRHGLAIGPNGMVAITGYSDMNFNSGLLDEIYDYVTIVYSEYLAPVCIERIPAGVRLGFTGMPGSIYQVQRAPAVNGPWITLATLTVPTGGFMEYNDTTPLVGSAFYRMSTP